MLRSACSLPLLLAAALVAPGSAFAADGWSPAALEREVAALTAELGRAGRPAPPLDHLGPRVELQGEVTVYYEDGEDGNARLRHVIATSRGRRSLHFAGRLPDLLSGDRIRVRGVEVTLDSGPEPSAVVAYCCEGDGVETVAALPLPRTTGEQRTAVLLVNFQNNAVEPWSIAEAASLVFSALNDVLLELSYDASWLAGDVFGYYTLAMDESCLSLPMAEAAKAAAAADGVDLSAYDRIVYLHPRITSILCGFAGKGTIGGEPSEAWINGPRPVGLMAHEIGHNLGLYHSHSVDCGASSLGADCALSEYGDLADAMGGNNGHFNAFQKERLGWLLPQDVAVAATGGVHRIEAFETLPGGLPKTLKVPGCVDGATGLPLHYYLEYRRPVGADAFLSAWDPVGGNLTDGLLVRTGAEGDPNSSFLLDTTPASNTLSDWGDAALAFGASYADPASGTTITASWGDGGVAEVAVVAGPGCGSSDPPPDPDPGPALNTPPSALDDEAATSQNTEVAIAVLANDSDPDRDPLSVADVSPPAHGRVRVEADGSIVYTPDRRYEGPDVFAYSVSDGQASASAQVFVSVEPKRGGGGRGRGK